jgi:hypothetical protein
MGKLPIFQFYDHIILGTFEVWMIWGERPLMRSDAEELPDYIILFILS